MAITNLPPVTVMQPRNIPIIPDSIIYIWDYAFAGCDNLSLIMLPDTDVELYAGVFEDTAYYNNPANWSNGILYIGDYLVFAEPSISGVAKIKQG